MVATAYIQDNFFSGGGEMVNPPPQKNKIKVSYKISYLLVFDLRGGEYSNPLPLLCLRLWIEGGFQLTCV